MTNNPPPRDPVWWITANDCPTFAGTIDSVRHLCDRVDRETAEAMDGLMMVSIPDKIDRVIIRGEVLRDSAGIMAEVFYSLGTIESPDPDSQMHDVLVFYAMAFRCRDQKTAVLLRPALADFDPDVGQFPNAWTPLNGNEFALDASGNVPGEQGDPEMTLWWEREVVC